MSLITELKQIYYDLPLAAKPDREKVAHFCEHNGVFVQFTRARAIWHALAPSTVRPWWMILEPVRTGNDNNKKQNNKNVVEVNDNAQ